MTDTTTTDKPRAVLPFVTRSEGFLGLKRKSFTLVLTAERLLFALVTKERQRAAAEQARDEAKAAGKGLMASWGAVVASGAKWTERYLELEPDEILAEKPENFAVARGDIRSLRIDRREAFDPDGANTAPPLLRIKTATGKLEFQLEPQFTPEMDKTLEGWLARGT